MPSNPTLAQESEVDPDFSWAGIASTILASRAIDAVEESRLVPEKKVLYQFSARGHELAQCLLGSLLDRPRDAAAGYYRSRPLLLTLGLDLVDAVAGPLMKSGGFSDGRDIGVVANMPRRDGPIFLPMAGDVGSQYTPAAGWAQAILYRRDVLGDVTYGDSIAVVLGGEGSVATNGFWSALTMATTLKLPLLFFIEDNGFGISVPGKKQTPGGDIARNLRSFTNLRVFDGDGGDPADAAGSIGDAVRHVRSGAGPALIRLTVPRLCGHSFQDTQAYKGAELIEAERARDPLGRLREFLVPAEMSEDAWGKLESEAQARVAAAVEEALARPEPDVRKLRRYVYAETKADGSADLPILGGLSVEAHAFPPSSSEPRPEAARINMLDAIRRTLGVELRTNPKTLVFGEDVGLKGGVHAATRGLQKEFGPERVFDTSLSEEGIIGRAVGMAMAGLMPVAEIQFRKYADPATEQLKNCGTLRWRTCNRFAAPIVVRMPGGFAKCGDPWHSECGEVTWAHAIGWQLAFPSNAEDAVGLLRAAMRSDNPTIFFEHRELLDAAWARRPYPGDAFILPMGKARIVREGEDLTVVTWGAMVERCERAADAAEGSVEIIDLRTIVPWDREAVLASVRKTQRCLIVHEDALTAGFGSEICAVLVKEAFDHLAAPIDRLAVPDVPIPHNIGLMNAALPSVDGIAAKMKEVIEF